jgi:hypothetical protein
VQTVLSNRSAEMLADAGTIMRHDSGKKHGKNSRHGKMHGRMHCKKHGQMHGWCLSLDTRASPQSARSLAGQAIRHIPHNTRIQYRC